MVAGVAKRTDTQIKKKLQKKYRPKNNSIIQEAVEEGEDHSTDVHALSLAEDAKPSRPNPVEELPPPDEDLSTSIADYSIVAGKKRKKKKKKKRKVPGEKSVFVDDVGDLEQIQEKIQEKPALEPIKEEQNLEKVESPRPIEQQEKTLMQEIKE